MSWLRSLPSRLTHPIALLGVAFACSMCSGQASPPGSQNGQGGSSSAGGPSAGSSGMTSGGSAGGGPRTTNPNGVTFACTVNSDCSLPASYCNPATGGLTYYLNPRCDQMLCSYEFAYASCPGGTTTAGGLGVGGAFGQGGSSGSGGQGADGGAAGESGADPGGAASN